MAKIVATVTCLLLSIAASGQDITVRTLHGIRFADQFAGLDGGAKINAADTDLGPDPGEIWMNRGCGTLWFTTVRLSPNRVLRFIQGGTYTGGSGLAGQLISAIGSSSHRLSNIHVVGNGIGTTHLSAPRSGGQLGAVLQFAYRDDCGVENLTADGNGNSTTVLVDEMNRRLVARDLRLLGDTSFTSSHNYCLHVRGSQYGSYDNIEAVGGAQDAILIGSHRMRS